ncbi:MAG: c-type cytochrome [Verrucomicrobiota bacterium]|nr:c-type cytochrome [Verrucomicrobiota bacterium]
MNPSLACRVWLIFASGIFLLFSSRTVSAAEEASAPVPLSEAAGRMNYPEGFRVTLFAGEPDIVQPIAMAFDPRGRLWVVECLSYPQWTTNQTGGDRVLIFEDKNNDGKFDTRKVFLENGRNLTGIAFGFDGVFLCSSPELIFVADKNGDDLPDGPPEALLDGWSITAKHNVFNGLAWGPDGWLYGSNGILDTSKVGKPGASDAERVAVSCGVWRYHPVKRKFEVVARGSTNPWGVAFDENGQAFVANCVIKHLFHMVPGGRYERMYGQDANPLSFHLIPSCADHIHWAGGFWKTEGAEHSQNDSAGGGHAHSGALIYLGDNWPDRYRGHFFTLNIHGHRINNDQLIRNGSGFSARHRPDFLKANDDWFRGVALAAAPDGSVFMCDWSDAGECHDYVDIHRENGRIYKIFHGQPKAVSRNVGAMTDNELIKLQLEKNEWLVTASRLELQKRFASGALKPGAADALKELMRTDNDARRQLRFLWALHTIGGLDSTFAEQALKSPAEYVRAWAVQLSIENGATPELLKQFAEMAESDRSPVVRLYLASALQKLGLKEGSPIATGLVKHAGDAADPNLPSMIWYGIEPMISNEATLVEPLLLAARIPQVIRYIAQRLALREQFAPIITALKLRNPATEVELVRGLYDALNGRRNITAPVGWEDVEGQLLRHGHAETREQALGLGLIFNRPAALKEMRARIIDGRGTLKEKQQSIDALISARPEGVIELLRSAFEDKNIRASVIRGLAAVEDPRTPELLLTNYSTFNTEEKIQAINTLSTRPRYAEPLLMAMKSGTIPVRDVSPFNARQILAHKDEKITGLLKDVVGEVRRVGEEKAAQVEAYKKMLQPGLLQQADLRHGRQLFEKTCAACHTLFGVGGKLAPELTGSQRSSLDYLLENIVDPNAVVWDIYKATYFETADDRLISGIVLRENESTVTIQTQDNVVTLPRNDITSRQNSSLSLMPEGLLDPLTEQEVIDLIAYLQSPSQVSLPR